MRTSTPVVRSVGFQSATHAELVRRLPTPFQLFRYVAGTEHLHFGLFEHAAMPLTAAQECNTEHLLRAIPRAAARVLDVGCGIGGTSVLLAQRGHDVVALAPDAALIDYARAQARRNHVAHRCDFHAVRLQELPATVGRFDVVLSQESLQYIHPLGEAMLRIAALVKPGGRVVVGDQTLRAPELAGYCQFHSSEDIRAAAAAAGLRLVQHQDVSAQAAPSVRVAMQKLQALRAEMVEFFAPVCADIEQHLDVCLHNGGLEADCYERGQLGYEHFVWERPAD